LAISVLGKIKNHITSYKILIDHNLDYIFYLTDKLTVKIAPF
jgi:hypothetical protein